jgi:hypothetical protein
MACLKSKGITTTIPFITDPTVAKVVVAWKGVAFCRTLGFQRVIFEGDALEIVNALRQDSPCWSHYGQMIEDTKVLLYSFPSWSIRHTEREANEAVHCCAKYPSKLIGKYLVDFTRKCTRSSR